MHSVKGKDMIDDASAHLMNVAETVLRQRTTVETTLYDLITAIREEISPDEEHLVTPIVVHLLNSGCVKFVDGIRHHRIICT